MTRDTRTYVRIHDGMPDHPKVVGLSDAAFRSYVELICWCSRHLTDGRVPCAAARRLGSPKALREIGAAGLIQVDGAGWLVRDYLQHQRSADEVASLREKRRESGSRGGIAKAKAVALATPVAKQNSGIDRDIEQNKTKAPSSAAADALFAEFWQHYPRKVGKQDAEKMFHRQRRKTDPELIIAGAVRLAADPNLPDSQFIPHPATWLARGGWDDEPYPGPDAAQAGVPEGWR